MNTVSWFLYVAGVIGNISGLLIAAGLMLLAVYIFHVICEADEAEPNMPSVPKFVGTAFAMFLVAAILPSTETVYLIAASELGEEVITSDAANEMYSRVEKFLDLKLEAMESE